MSDNGVDTKIASYFERPGHRDAVVDGIVHGALALKFAYAGSAAHTHDRLADHEGYQSVTGAVPHVRAALRRAGLDRLPSVVEVGPGNGVSSLALLRQLDDAECPPSDYLGLDFSETLLKIAQDTFGPDGHRIRFTGRVWDVEDGPTTAIEDWRPGPAPLTVLFLGNTIGNFERPVAALRHIHQSLRIGDTLVVGATLRRRDAEREAMTAPYRNPVFTAAALEPLIAGGVGADDIDFQLEYEKDEVIGTAVLRRAVTCPGAVLPAGHRVRCFVSRRFLAGEIDNLVSSAGFRPFASSVDESAEHLVITAVKDDDAGTSGP